MMYGSSNLVVTISMFSSTYTAGVNKLTAEDTGGECFIRPLPQLRLLDRRCLLAGLSRTWLLGKLVPYMATPFGRFLDHICDGPGEQPGVELREFQFAIERFVSVMCKHFRDKDKCPLNRSRASAQRERSLMERWSGLGLHSHRYPLLFPDSYLSAHPCPDSFSVYVVVVIDHLGPFFGK